jgi:signal transduction histidine kinase
MRERAKVVGGHLDVWSDVGSGTEVELTIPASAAYATGRARGRWSLFTRKAGTNS